MKKLLILISIFLLGCANTQQASFEQAQATYAAGNYSLAFRQLWAPVQAQDPRAMYAMGYMYYYGIGTNKDEDIGLNLINAAAIRHCPSAVIALKLIQEHKYNQYAPMEPFNSYAPRGTVG